MHIRNGSGLKADLYNDFYADSDWKTILWHDLEWFCREIRAIRKIWIDDNRCLFLEAPLSFHWNIYLFNVLFG